MKQVRLVAAVIHLELVIDDGEQLHPLRVEPIRLAAADVSGFDVDSAVTDVQRQIDASEKPPQDS